MKTRRDFIQQAVEESTQLKHDFFRQYSEQVLQLAELLERIRKEKRKALLLGNGGSAADAQHFASELMHRVEAGKIGLRAIALHTDTSLLTALSNDEGYESVFAAQIETLADPGDCVIAFSTSGNSTNIVEALRTAKSKQCVTVGLLGRDGGMARALCDVALVVPHTSTPRIQEVHVMILHIVSQILERTRP